MFDNSHPCDNEDNEILTLLERYASSKQMIKVLNKVDLASQFDKSVLGNDYLELSCKTSSDALTQKLQAILDQTAHEDSIMLTSTRQIDAVKKAHENVKAAYFLLNEGALELFAFHINEAIQGISSITTAFERDEILDKMFGNFCLGK